MKLATDLLDLGARLKAEETLARKHIKELEDQLALLRARVAEITAERERLLPPPKEEVEVLSPVTPEAENPNVTTNRQGFVTHWKGKPLFSKGATSKRNK